MKINYFKRKGKEGRRNSRLLIFLLLLVVSVGLYQIGDVFIPKKGARANTAISVFSNGTNTVSKSEAEENKNSKKSVIKRKGGPFNSLNLIASAAIVMNVRTKEVLYEKNSYAQLPLASLTKVMSALVSQETYAENETLTIPKRAIGIYGQSNLQSGAVWSFRELLNYSLVTSSNDGIAAIAMEAFPSPGSEHFVEMMNKKAKKIGLSQTYFLNATGLDISNAQSGAYGSAFDIAGLFAYIYRQKPDLLEATKHSTYTAKNSDGEILIGVNTNEDIVNIPSLIASKTGFTDLAKGNLAILYNAGISQPIIIVVLGSTREGRFLDVQNLIRATFDSLGPPVKVASPETI